MSIRAVVRSRRRFTATVLFAVGVGALVAIAAGTAAAIQKTYLWECNWCHQQYQGPSPPAFAKCPAKEMKQNHWWIRKGSP